MINDETCFYVDPSLDLSQDVIKALDAQPEKDDDNEKGATK